MEDQQRYVLHYVIDYWVCAYHMIYYKRRVPGRHWCLSRDWFTRCQFDFIKAYQINNSAPSRH